MKSSRTQPLEAGSPGVRSAFPLAGCVPERVTDLKVLSMEPGVYEVQWWLTILILSRVAVLMLGP